MKIIFKNLAGSFKQIKLKMLVPDIFYIIFGAAIFWIFGSYTGLNALSQDEVYKNVTENFSRFVSSFIVILIIGFFVGARLKAFKLVMILKSSNNKTFHLFESYKESAKFYWRVVSLKIISFLLLLIGFTIAVLVYLVLETINPLIASIVAVLIIIAFFLALFFKEAALFKQDTSASNAVGISYEIFRRKFFSVLITSVLVLLINFIGVAANAYFPQAESAVSSILSFIYLIVVFLISIWTQLFIFNNYDSLKPKKTQITSKKNKSKKSKVI